jgi:hypothetical protein
MNKILSKKIFNKIVTALSVFVLFFAFYSSASAETEISTCQTLSMADTYILTADLTNPINGTCLVIEDDDVIIDGQGLYTINGRVLGSGVEGHLSGYNFTFKNVTVTGDVFSRSVFHKYGGIGGTVTVENSTTTNIDVAARGDGGTVNISTSTVGNIYADVGSNLGNGGNINIVNSSFGNLIANSLMDTYSGGNISISGNNIDLSNKTITCALVVVVIDSVLLG